MSKSSLVLVAVLTCGLAFLSSGETAEAAVGLIGGVNKVIEGDSVQPIHYSHRYGWPCGMWERYGHGHMEQCWRRGPRWGASGVTTATVSIAEKAATAMAMGETVTARMAIAKRLP